MKRFVALLCFLVILFGSAICEEDMVQLPDEEIIEETQEEIIEEPIIEEPVIEEEIEPLVEESPPIEEEIQIEEPISITEEPITEEPIIEEPIIEEVIEESEIAPEQKSEEEITEEPVVEQEIVEEPIVEEPIEEIIEEAEQIIEEEISEEETIEVSEEEEEEEIIIDDDDEGYVDDAILPREVHITFQKEPYFYGDEVILAATLINFRFEDNYTIYWQYCEDPNAEEIKWNTIEGEHEQLYRFILDKTNYVYGYRVLVVVEE